MNTDQRLFLYDFNYKFVKPLFSLSKTEPVNLIIPIWRLNRLSLIRGICFLEKFFSPFYIHKQTIFLGYSRTIKKSKKKLHLCFKIPIHNNFPLLQFLLYYLPEPILHRSTQGYFFVFHLHHFTIQLFITVKTPIFTYKLLTGEFLARYGVLY